MIASLNMIVAAFIRQAGDPFGEVELALAYLFAFAALVFTGAGGFSVDALWRRLRVQRARLTVTEVP
jgi:uncharacterized membrane protein YphA (DoxX/SURF4 family)